MRRLSVVLVALAGVVLLATGWWMPLLGDQAGPTATPLMAQPVEDSPTPTPTATSTPTLEPTPTPTATATPTASPTPSATATPVTTETAASDEEEMDAAVALPMRLRIPSIEADAEIEFVGLTPEGAMDTPGDPDNVAWLDIGPRPGQRGNAAITGHVDWAGQVRAFWGIKDLEEGDLIEVIDEAGGRHRFAVKWVRWYLAADAPLEEVFGSSDAREITLITCGGDFDRRTRQYLSRVVVRGVLQ